MSSFLSLLDCYIQLCFFLLHDTGYQSACSLSRASVVQAPLTSYHQTERRSLSRSKGVTSHVLAVPFYVLLGGERVGFISLPPAIQLFSFCGIEQYQCLQEIQPTFQVRLVMQSYCLYHLFLVNC